MIYTKCKFCPEWRDSSNRYTSPANAARDYKRWVEIHESGLCATLTPDELHTALYGIVTED